jgi:(1->4)-alpha-D-glucan 1-alpha-D-glucosylmutase
MVAQRGFACESLVEIVCHRLLSRIRRNRHLKVESYLRMPVPLSTYRLQLHAKFTFYDALAIADYLRELGVSHVYSSPYLQAAQGSTHGYDVVDHNCVNDELGGAKGHERFQIELGRADLGQVLDIVPNHMAIGTRANAQWWDVLENGPSSKFADFFDVDWDPPEAKLRNTVLVPVLGDHYGRVLEAGELKIEREGGKFVVRYHEHVYPLAPDSISALLARAAEGADDDDLAFLADTLSRLPRPTWTDRASKERRHRNKEIVARDLAVICETDPRIARAIDQELAETNVNADALDLILSQQNYRLAYWKTAGRELPYRRFFDINTLAGLRMEDERVFQFTHRLILGWLRTGVLDGLRIDHPDGLRHPSTYFERLHTSAPDAWIVAEKILEPGEELRPSWPIAGTTGYEFLFRANSLFVDPAGEKPLTDFYAEFTGESTNLREIVRFRKEQVLRETLGSDVNQLTALFSGVCEAHRRFRDFTRHDIHQAMRTVISSFPVYRTYVIAEMGRVGADDIRYVNEAIDDAKRRRTDTPADLFDFMRSVLLLEVRGEREAEFVMRFQQFTGPAMAKGVEDTTFYVFNRLVSLNEVGGNPGVFGISVEEFHRLTEQSFRRWPTAMLAGTTHDTKRSEDVRARINLISEMPVRWIAAVRRWSAYNERHRTNDLPDRNMEYLFYQTLFGAWPIEVDRIANYMEKASREAKTHTSWTAKNNPYDQALQKFVHAACSDSEFLHDIGAFTEEFVWPGRLNSLSQTLLRLTAPGVPDLYQGTEIWNLSLVDPDNRRPVDYAFRRGLLSELDRLTVEEVCARADSGLPKLLVSRRALQLRRERPHVFGRDGTYQPVRVTGERAHHVVGFMRGGEVITIAPRLVLGLAGGQGPTIELPEGEWRNVFTGDVFQGGSTDFGMLTTRFPVCLLTHT